MTSDFTPGKAYLIEGKGIEQVKSEIKDWLVKNEMEMLMESEDMIEAHRYGFYYYYEFYFLVKIVENPEGTLAVFSDKISKDILFRNLSARILLKDKREDMIRFLNGKKELNVDLKAYARIMYLISALIGLIAFLFLFNIDLYLFFLIFMPISLLLTLFNFLLLPWHITKNKNLPEYKVEEYKGEIEIDL